jgi:uncharacterized membrane protein YgcG
VPAGEAFTARQQDEIVKAIKYAQQEGDLIVSVYVGQLEGESREYALKLHAALESDAPHSALVAVDPGSRRLEIVTGSECKRRLDDRACGLTALSMTTAFQAGDLAGGIANGVRMLAEHARAPKSLHTENYGT